MGTQHQKLFTGILLSIPLLLLSVGREVLLLYPWFFGIVLPHDPTRHPATDPFNWLFFALATPVLFYSGSPVWGRAQQALSRTTLSIEVCVVLAAGVAYLYSVGILITGIEGYLYFETAALVMLLSMAGVDLERHMQDASTGAPAPRAASAAFPSRQLLNRLTTWYMPLVIVVVLLTLVGWVMFAGMPAAVAGKFAVAAIIAACPASLALMVPATLLTGSMTATERGMIVNNAHSLDRARTIHTVVVDRAALLTDEALPVVTTVLQPAGDSHSIEDTAASPSPVPTAEPHQHIALPSPHSFVLWVAASVAQTQASVPARAIVQEAQRRNIALAQPQQVEWVDESSVVAHIEEYEVMMGPLEWLGKQGVTLHDAEHEVRRVRLADNTVVTVAVNGGAVGVVTVAGSIHPAARVAVAALHQGGMDVVLAASTTIAPGDDTDEALAHSTGIRHVLADASPHETVAAVEQWQARGRVVAVVSGSAEHADALAQADVRVAMAIESDAVLEVADIVLMQHSLLAFTHVITLSRAIRKTIRANLFWVCFFHLLGLILATGLLYPAIGVQMRPSGVVLFTILGLVFAGVNTWHLRGVVLEA